MNKIASPQAIADCHNLLLWLTPHIDRFPRVRRHTLGERLELTVLDILESLIIKYYRPLFFSYFFALE